MLIDASFQCAYCWQTNHTEVDPSGGAHQQYVEDCQVCCRPNVLTISVDRQEHAADIMAERENL
jgi:hypothetical protein